MNKLDFDPQEEWLNSLTHGVGAAFSIVGSVLLVLLASYTQDPWKIVGFIIFSISLIALYLASTFYHGAKQPALRNTLKLVDHCAIFILIAGTYTPFLLVNLRGSVGWVLFAIVWSLALTGILIKMFYGDRFKAVRLIIYLTMGWLILGATSELLANINGLSFAFLVAGGITYTVGIIFYLAESMPYSHTIWHLFVIGGSVFHYFAIYVGVLPYEYI